MALRSRGRFPGTEKQTWLDPAGAPWSIEKEIRFDPDRVTLSSDGVVAYAPSPQYIQPSEFPLESGILVRITSTQSITVLPILRGSLCTAAIPAINDEWLVAAGYSGGAARLLLMDLSGYKERAEIVAEGATTVAVRLGESSLTVADDRGRVLVIDLEQGRLLRDLRL